MERFEEAASCGIPASAIAHRWALIEEQGLRATDVREFRRDAILGDEPKVHVVRVIV